MQPLENKVFIIIIITVPQTEVWFALDLLRMRSFPGFISVIELKVVNFVYILK